jgi:uncharacterized LabA/DUF88 family protein
LRDAVADFYLKKNVIVLIFLGQRERLRLGGNVKTAIFIDGANIHAASKAVGYEVDYSRLIPAFTGNQSYTFLRAIYYTATLTQEDGSDNLRKLKDHLEYNGYTVVTKDSKKFRDATGMVKVKGNMDVEIAVDVLRMSEYVHNIILFTGDGDFTYLVKAVQDRGCRVTIVSAMDMVADELRRQADTFIAMDDPNVRSAIRRERKGYARTA